MHEDMIKFTCEHCKTTVVQPKNEALPFIPTPTYWSRFRVDFYGDKITSPKECDLCPKCALLFKRLTRSFFGWNVKDLDAEIEKILNDASTDEEDDTAEFNKHMDELIRQDAMIRCAWGIGTEDDWRIYNEECAKEAAKIEGGKTDV